MSVRREGNRWLAVVKHRGQYHSSKSFDLRRDAEAWEARQRALLSGGFDPRAGDKLVQDLITEWLEARAATVAFKTYQADRNLVAWVPLRLMRSSVGKVTTAGVNEALRDLGKTGKARSSIQRFKGMLSAFFTWAVTEGYAERNPVQGARVPSSARPPEEMRPFSPDELREHLEVWKGLDPDAAMVVTFLAASGLRWEEARELRVADVQRVPYLAVRVARAQPEGGTVKETKGRQLRRVPMPDDVSGWLLARTTARDSEAYVLPIRWVNTVRRRLRWKQTSSGRSIHDLRHTAITHWLGAGIDVGTVRVWAGHSDLTTTSRYTHWAGLDSDLSALERVNRARASLGQVQERGEAHR